MIQKVALIYISITYVYVNEFMFCCRLLTGVTINFFENNLTERLFGRQSLCCVYFALRTLKREN